LILGLLLAMGPDALAEAPSLSFRPAGEGLFDFDTGSFRGRLKLDNKYQGLHPLIDSVTGQELTNPPGVFSPYRVFSTNRRYGDAARDWTTRTRLLDDGGVEAFWPSAAEHPLEMTAVYRWTAPDTLDLAITVRPQVALPRFELFMSSYFTQGFRASAYVQGNGDEPPRFVSADRPAESERRYVMYPRDQDAVAMIRDGRWAVPPSPVDWAVQRRLAAPMAVRRDAKLNLTALMMSPSESCFAVASPWNPESPTAGGYRSLYLSLFGQDLNADQVAVARCRLVIRRALTDDDAVRCLEQYLKQPP
jgi:hypothetical protein